LMFARDWGNGYMEKNRKLPADKTAKTGSISS